ncbi:hypothetical protein EXIGLDRAFT_832481 [Exidia glandulosa HHB12029]|uniref:Uncharacterized protein n=1 Tax=Exidia glandulosa HHB12029 TaxID=1314781 RepID=A0A165LLY6_EXIGL|nr:hypothetical protein EXIGLDRAFT_832481 [Exidia glandulosa HHB12029]
MRLRMLFTPGNVLIAVLATASAYSLVCGNFNGQKCPKKPATAAGVVGLVLSTLVSIMDRSRQEEERTWSAQLRYVSGLWFSIVRILRTMKLLNVTYSQRWERPAKNPAAPKPDPAPWDTAVTARPSRLRRRWNTLWHSKYGSFAVLFALMCLLAPEELNLPYWGLLNGIIFGAIILRHLLWVRAEKSRAQACSFYSELAELPLRIPKSPISTETSTDTRANARSPQCTDRRTEGSGFTSLSVLFSPRAKSPPIQSFVVGLGWRDSPQPRLALLYLKLVRLSKKIWSRRWKRVLVYSVVIATTLQHTALGYGDYYNIYVLASLLVLLCAMIHMYAQYRLHRGEGGVELTELPWHSSDVCVEITATRTQNAAQPAKCPEESSKLASVGSTDEAAWSGLIAVLSTVSWNKRPKGIHEVLSSSGDETLAFQIRDDVRASAEAVSPTSRPGDAYCTDSHSGPL